MIAAVFGGLLLAATGAASDTIVVIETAAGSIILELYEESAPRTTANFLRYVDAGLYEGGTFYRTVRQDNQPDDDVRIEVIQGGVNPARAGEVFDPIAMESTGITGLRHTDGTISMARGESDSARGEFFVTIGDQPELDEGGRRNPDGRGFAAFGRVVYGMDVVRAIHRAAADGQRLMAPVEIGRVATSARRGGSDLAPPTSASAGLDAEGLLAAWVSLWRTYDLDRVPELFLPDARVNYLSSEREGLIVGIDDLLVHHEGFGFVGGGLEPTAELWVEDVEGVSYGNTAVVTAVWYFGDRGARADAQRGPMTAVYTLYGGEYRIAHMHFANYEP
ncbi:MAG: peptidylprolyl isomerase [Gemmatimonadota bacterium]|nr:peptidylprolyl isomerase [Gemmatimonadota bacterium]